MTHALLALNALALTAVIAMSLLPGEAPVHSLDYRSAMQARPAVLGQAPQELPLNAPVSEQDHLSF